MSATCCIVALSSTHKTIFVTGVLQESQSLALSVVSRARRGGQFNRRESEAVFGRASLRRMPTHHTPVHLAAAEAVASRAGVAATDLKVENPKPEFGDFAIGCFSIAK